MATLETTFAGLKLKNPIIISSSGLTDSAAKNQKLYEAGAGAIVLKSLFEEQIMMEADWLGDPNMYPEGSDYLVGYIREHKLGEYLNLIKETKKVCDIPVIASINCYQDADWIEFARKIEEAGADALEVNILALQTDIQYAYGSFEQRHIDILSHIRKTVNIPVIMKLGDNLTNPIALIDQLYANGAAAVVMFNRFYQPDIDIEKMAQSAGSVFSTDADLSKSLRWIGIASAAVSKLDYAASGGIPCSRRSSKSYLGGRFGSRDMQRTLSEFLRHHRRVCPLPERMDGTQRDGEHQPVQRHAECKRPERYKHFRTYPVPKILLGTQIIKIWYTNKNGWCLPVGHHPFFYVTFFAFTRKGKAADITLNYLPVRSAGYALPSPD